MRSESSKLTPEAVRLSKSSPLLTTGSRLKQKDKKKINQKKNELCGLHKKCLLKRHWTKITCQKQQPNKWDKRPPVLTS